VQATPLHYEGEVCPPTACGCLFVCVLALGRLGALLPALKVAVYECAAIRVTCVRFFLRVFFVSVYVCVCVYVLMYVFACIRVRVRK